MISLSAISSTSRRKSGISKIKLGTKKSKGLSK